jgi:hypothetical protein
MPWQLNLKHAMKFRLLLLSGVCCYLLSGCAASKNYDPNKKYAPAALKKDYTLLRDILETKHPSLYWYTPKDSMDHYFETGLNQLTDSMTELQFGWKVLAPLLHNIHCGHTGFSMSKDWNRYIKDKQIPSFPLYLKVWNDTMVVEFNMNKNDSIKKGMIITAINGVKARQIISTLFQSMIQDGYEDNFNYVRLSVNFPFFHRNVYGLSRRYKVDYIDSIGLQRSRIINMFPIPDTTKKPAVKVKTRKVKEKKLSRAERLAIHRSLEVDTANSLAIIRVNTFSAGHLTSFFKQSFHQIRKDHIQNVALDLRANGGGYISKYIDLAKYIRKSPFKACDTAFAVSKSLRPYKQYIRNGWINNIGLWLFTNKHKDGLYHFGYWERHHFKPAKNDHFDGNVFVMTNGYTFSSSALFCNSVKGQDNVKLIGENTGGGWYGNDGILIPDIVLPVTKVRVSLPLFRLVQYQHPFEKGTGVIPDIYIGPSLDAVREDRDLKLELIKKIIREQQK